MGAFQRSAVVAALNVCQGSIEDTVIQLGLPRKTLHDKIKKHGLDKSELKD
jgi:two-component system C4-dicarboxylate transport response regulator DctD